MTIEKIPFFLAEWDEAKKLLYTRLTGLMNYDDIDQWKLLVQSEASKIRPGTMFKFYIDESGYEYVNADVHVYKRNFLPEFLASYGFYLSLLPAEEIERLKNAFSLNASPNSSRCIAMAMNHHNSEVMSSLDEQFGNETEHYFSNSNDAKEWIENV